MAVLRPSAADPRWETRAAATGIAFVVLAGRPLFDLGNMAFLLSGVPAATLVAAASLGALRTALLPDWLAWAGVGFSVFAIIDVLGRLAGDSAAFGPGGVIGTIVFVAFLAWTLAASGLLVQRARR